MRTASAALLQVPACHEVTASFNSDPAEGFLAASAASLRTPSCRASGRHFQLKARPNPLNIIRVFQLHTQVLEHAFVADAAGFVEEG